MEAVLHNQSRFFILIIFVVFYNSCIYKKSHIKNNNYSNRFISNDTILFFDDYFTISKNDTLSINLDINNMDKYMTGKKINTVYAYSVLNNFLNYKSLTNCDFFAINKIIIDSNNIGYIIRHPGYIDSDIISLFIFDKNKNKIINKIDLSSHTGDEGYEYIKRATIYLRKLNIIKIKNLEYYNSFLIKDTTYIINIK